MILVGTPTISRAAQETPKTPAGSAVALISPVQQLLDAPLREALLVAGVETRDELLYSIALAQMHSRDSAVAARPADMAKDPSLRFAALLARAKSIFTAETGRPPSPMYARFLR